MTEFVVVDVETANADYSSICQIGIVEFSHGKVVGEWSTYIDPRAYFDSYNISIHGISSATVRGSPTFSQAFPSIDQKLRGKLVLHHGHFDRVAFERCYELYRIEPIECKWLDNTRVVRRTWEEFSKKGYGLSNLARVFSINLEHHDALSDARAAGEIFCLALQKSGISPSALVIKAHSRAADPGSKQDFTRNGSPSAPFHGEKIVFTGSLSVDRKTAADFAQALGFDVQNGVTKDTTFLCVGMLDSRNLAGYEKSSKQRKAEELASQGQDISILSERDFWTLARQHGVSGPSK